jgi:hypothetical protein
MDRLNRMLQAAQMGGGMGGGPAQVCCAFFFKQNSLRYLAKEKARVLRSRKSPEDINNPHSCSSKSSSALIPIRSHHAITSQSSKAKSDHAQYGILASF